MIEGSGLWLRTTHDWAAGVDHAHLDMIRSRPGTYAPGGLLHLVLEVTAYAQDEAEALGRPGVCRVIVCADGSVSVSDDGRGTDTRRDAAGQVIRKPVMATPDLRFFATAHRPVLPDGHRRHGMSVVTALSRWLTHTNHRQDGAWTQRYEHGVPTTDIVPVRPSAAPGTTVRFSVNPDLVPTCTINLDQLRTAAAAFSWLTTDVTAE
jgi:topoisomerase IV subunit B